jgi:para-aminobenzoate synthetase/4-amino-4-deoxychorismate lyase
LFLLDFPTGLQRSSRLKKQWGASTQVWTTHRLDEVRPILDAAHQAALAGQWVVGFVTYEAAAAFDAAAQVHAPLPGWPLIWFAAMGEEIGLPANKDFRVGSWQDLTTPEQFQRHFEQIRQAIQAGDTYQINYTTRLQARFEGAAASFFTALQRSQPEGYSLFIDLGQQQLCSVSPELFFHWQDGVLTTQPMKGTAARGANATDDADAAQALRHSRKEQAENLMIVDLLRNDMARLSVPGSVRVPHLFELQALPTVWQMTSTIQSQTRNGTRLSDVFQALFPCGSVTGAPKIRSMQIIRALEWSARGVYCGAAGVLQPGGTATFNVAIRTVTLQQQQATCGIGSGITWDAKAAQEQAEFEVKRRFLERARAPFQLLETLKLSDGHYWLEARHLERLRRSAEHFNFCYSVLPIKEALQRLTCEHAAGDWRVRLLLDPEGQVQVEAEPLTHPGTALNIQLARQAVNSADEFLRHKTTWREVYAAHVPLSDDIFDTLLWNEKGELTEFTKGNVILTLKGRDYTPDTRSGLLPGCLREELLQTGRLQERILSRDDLVRAERVLFINSVRGCLPVAWPPTQRK